MSNTAEAVSYRAACACEVGRQPVDRVEGRFERSSGRLFGVFTCNDCGRELERFTATRRQVELYAYMSGASKRELDRFLSTMPPRLPPDAARLLIEAAGRSNIADLFPVA